MNKAQLTDPVVSALVDALQEEHQHRQEGIAMMKEILQANCLVKWIEMEDGPMGEDNNMWDWDGNNDN